MNQHTEDKPFSDVQSSAVIDRSAPPPYSDFGGYTPTPAAAAFPQPQSPEYGFNNTPAVPGEGNLSKGPPPPYSDAAGDGYTAPVEPASQPQSCAVSQQPDQTRASTRNEIASHTSGCCGLGECAEMCLCCAFCCTCLHMCSECLECLTFCTN